MCELKLTRLHKHSDASLLTNPHRDTSQVLISVYCLINIQPFFPGTCR